MCKVWFDDNKPTEYGNVCTLIWNNVPILISSTAYGDGSYIVEENGSEFGVDAGVMAVVEKSKLETLLTKEDFSIDNKGIVAIVRTEGTIEADGRGNFQGAISVLTEDYSEDDEEEEYDDNIEGTSSYDD